MPGHAGTWYRRDILPPVIAAVLVAGTARMFFPTLPLGLPGVLALAGIGSITLIASGFASSSVRSVVSQRLADQLPPKLRAYVAPFPQYDPQFQGPFVFSFAPWAYEELHVPPISEPRNFRNVFNALRPYAKEPEDLRMIIGERGGRVMFYQGDASWPLQTK